MDFLRNISAGLDKVLAFVAGISLAIMITLTVSNIVLRQVWLPIKGTFELLGLFGAVTAAFALAYTQRQNMHIAVTILVDRFPPRVKRLLNIINAILCGGFFGLAAWRITVWSSTLVTSGELTETLQMPFYPFVYATALGCASLAFLFLVELLGYAFGKDKEVKS